MPGTVSRFQISRCQLFQVSGRFAMNIIRRLPIFIGIFIAGCTTGHPSAKTKSQIIATWLCPEQPVTFEEGNLAISSWPVGAVVSKDPFVPTGTLFLLASPDLTANSITNPSLDAIKCANTCGVFDLGGQWVSLTNELPKFFIVSYESGGTAGDTIEIYKHNISITPTGEQMHSFGLVWSGNSRLPVLLGNIGDKGKIALLVGSDTTNSSGAADTPQTYQVLEWINGQLCVRMVINVTDVPRYVTSISKL